MAELDGRTRLTMLPSHGVFTVVVQIDFCNNTEVYYSLSPDIVYNATTTDMTQHTPLCKHILTHPKPKYNLQLSQQRNQQEHEYMRAVIPFLRTVTTHFLDFGDVSEQAPNSRYTTPTSHKVLVHGRKSIKNIPVLVGTSPSTLMIAQLIEILVLWRSYAQSCKQLFWT